MQPYKFRYPEHERIHRRLYTLVGPGAAAFYKDACRLMEMDNPLESTTHIVGHLLRETESSLRSVLRSILVQTESKKKSINDTQKNEIVAILKVLEIPETFAAGEIWFKLAGKENEDALHKRAHRNDLAPPRNIDENFESFWRQINEFLDAVLDKFETRASIIRGNLDKLFIKIEPSNQDIDYLRLKIPNSAFALGYFFEHLESPAWLKPLKKAGFFANPPGMETDAYSGSFSFPAWPQSRYLIKVASHEPETVLEISKQLLDLGSNNIIKHWQRDWLSIIRDYISPELRQLYDQLVEEIGAPISLDSVDFGYSYAVQIGSDSPKTGAELVQMAQDNIHGLITYLREWEPSENLREKSRNDLAWELAEQVITPNPESFVSQIESFKELDPVFMVWLLRGLKKALENPPSEQPLFSWQPVINFCTWMHENLHEISNNSTSSGYSDWSQICDAIIELIKAGLLANESNKIPLTHRSQVWKLLESTINDPQVTPGFTPQYQGSNMSAYEASYNTVRGKAMQAVVDYTLWIRRDANGNPTSKDFNDLPQVQQILEQHLDPQQDPSSAIRAVYGNRFPHLYNLASEWALHNIDQIFPESPELQWMFEAAWEAYIHSKVFLDIFSVLRKKYNHAVEQLSVRNPTSRQQSEAGRALSSHLLCLFLWKEIGITESDGLLQKFFANASADLHQEFMRQISWKLLYGDLKLNEELRQRLQKLIEWRIADANNSTFPLEQVSDLKYFSWWFASGQFDNQWAIAKLLDVLEILKTVHHTSNFFEPLKRLASTLPQDVVRCLYIMAEGNQAKEWFLTYPTHYRDILKAVLQSEDEAVQGLARDLINRLLARNLGDYRNLLS